MQLIYNLAIYVYGGFMRLAGLFHPKAKKWVVGRKNWQDKLKRFSTPDMPSVWVHCASLGEFEQGRNIIEELKKQSPNTKILITFFSPSGYEIRKNYTLADGVMYLPLDTANNAKTFISILNPNLVILIKYELWLNFIFEIARKEIPIILISARVGADSKFLNSFFSPLYKKAFHSFTHIFTQDQASEALLESFSNNNNISTVADTRYDRVSSNREDFISIPEINKFKGERLCLVCGSTWKVGEEMIFKTFEELSEEFPLTLILAPHEINQDRIANWESRFPEITIRFSQIKSLGLQHKILWIDNIGILSRLYHYADIAYVGGGFGSGLHNILEAAVFGAPVIFGPKIRKFPEAQNLIKAKGGFSVKNQAEFTARARELLENKKRRDEISRSNITFVEEQAGATQKIIHWINSTNILN